MSDAAKAPVTARLEDMMRGWFVGDFNPSVLKTQNCEVAVRHHPEGDFEETHYHKIATEVTLILKGDVEMLGRRYGAGDIIVLEPGTATSFRAFTDTMTVVVKVPGAKNDKYLGTP